MAVAPVPAGTPVHMPGADGLETQVRDENELSLDQIDELIPLRMRVRGRRTPLRARTYTC